MRKVRGEIESESSNCSEIESRGDASQVAFDSIALRFGCLSIASQSTRLKCLLISSPLGTTQRQVARRPDSAKSSLDYLIESRLNSLLSALLRVRR